MVPTDVDSSIRKGNYVSELIMAVDVSDAVFIGKFADHFEVTFIDLNLQSSLEFD